MGWGPTPSPGGLLQNNRQAHPSVAVSDCMLCRALPNPHISLDGAVVDQRRSGLTSKRTRAVGGEHVPLMSTVEDILLDS